MSKSVGEKNHYSLEFLWYQSGLVSPAGQINNMMLIQQHKQFCGFMILYSPGPLHFQGSLVVPATPDSHQSQENPEHQTKCQTFFHQDKFWWCCCFGLSSTHSLPLFSFHRSRGVKRDRLSRGTCTSLRASGAVPSRQTITTLHLTHT